MFNNTGGFTQHSPTQQTFEKDEPSESKQNERLIQRFRLVDRRPGVIGSPLYSANARSFDESLIAMEGNNETQQSYKKTFSQIESVCDFYRYCIEQKRDELIKELIQAYAELHFNPISPSCSRREVNGSSATLTDAPFNELVCYQYKQPDLHFIQTFVQSNFGRIEFQRKSLNLQSNNPAVRRFTRASLNRTGSYGSPYQTSSISNILGNANNSFHLPNSAPSIEHQQSLLNHEHSPSANCSHKNNINKNDLTKIAKLHITANLRRTKIMYNCKFGQFGNQKGEFTEPSGIATNSNDDIIVADTNNHRIQVFDKEGSFLFQFGECGKRDGQLLYPNRVAVFKRTGTIVITERSPTHQVQLFTGEGVFLRKFGSDVLQHPRGVCVDQFGNIIVVECKVMRVFVFDTLGNVIHRFSCAKLVEFPNAIAVNTKNLIFISDNRSHCVKVFSYSGSLIRVIGAEGLTNFPIAVGIEQEDDGSENVLIADNHNSFNLTVFNNDGVLKKAFESKIRHAQCFDAALMSNGNIALSSKDYRVYIYRYKNDEIK